MFRPSEELILIHKSIENLPKVQEFLSSIAENSVFGNLGYKTSLACLHQFLTVKYSGMTLETIISSFKSGIDVYRFLNEFVSFLETKNLAKSTMHQYMTSVKSYLQFHDIDIVPYKFKKRVKLPKIPKKEELAIDQNDIRTILLQCHNHRLKTYLLVLASSGVRATEACALRIRDINFDESPTKIHIRAEYTKTKQDRDIYFSDEASKYLKEYIEQRFGIDLNKTKRFDEQFGDCLVFQVQDVNIRQVKPQAIYRKFVEEFHKVLDNVGFGQRKDGMSKRRKITLHSFRRFVKTVTSDQAGQDYSEWYLGHSKSSYYVSKPAVRAVIYGTKCMKYLTFLDYSTLEATGRSTEAKIEELQKVNQIMSQQHEEEMKAVNERMDRTDRILKLIEHNPILARAKRSAQERLANTK